MGLSRTVLRRLTDYDNPRSLGSRLRARRTPYLLATLAAVHAKTGTVRVIDVGGRKAFWQVLPEGAMQRYDVHVTVVNLPGEVTAPDDDRFTHIAGDGCDLDWVAEDAFDICHANSVLEHVGDWGRMLAFAREVGRVAPAYVVQTPYFWFPVEPHFLAPVYHWLPEPWRVRLMLRLSLGHSEIPVRDVSDAVSRVQSARLVDVAMFRALFPDATVERETFAGLTKSLIGVRQSR